jgi:hypothetical protein
MKDCRSGKRSTLLFAVMSLAAPVGLFAQDWTQAGRTAAHSGASDATGARLERTEQKLAVDPFADLETILGQYLLVHYPAVLIDGDDIYVLGKAGSYTGRSSRQTQVWQIKNLRRIAGSFRTRWTVDTDWKPVPLGANGPFLEPPYQCVIGSHAIWAPGRGGSMLEIDRETGFVASRITPFGPSIDDTIFLVGGPTIATDGSIYYTVIHFGTDPWAQDTKSSSLVRVSPDHSVSTAAFTTLVSGAPDPNSLCTTQFALADLPFPPSPYADAPTARCGSQRAALGAAPAVASDGTIYVISRSHFNAAWAYLIAVNNDLSPKWTASMRNRFNDGCNVSLPLNGTPGGCRNGASTGVDPSDNELGSGHVSDESSASPVVAPDGKILYGAYTRYNFEQGHLMAFNRDGSFAASYGAGWDCTPSIYKHDGGYSIVLKENHYDLGSYCNDVIACPARDIVAPSDEKYFITRLDSALQLESKFQNTNTQTCQRKADSSIACVSDHPSGFEWCVSQVAIDRHGVAYAASEDGFVYAIDRDGVLRERLLMDRALGAGYSPISIGADGHIYAYNNGSVFVIGSSASRRRSVNH